MLSTLRLISCLTVLMLFGAACNGEIVARERAKSVETPVTPIDYVARVKPAPSPLRALSNREYLTSVSQLIGVPLPLSLTAGWTPTSQYSGFDGIGWTNFESKLVRDRLASLDPILEAALAAPSVITCSVTSSQELAYEQCAHTGIERIASRAFRRPLSQEEIAQLKVNYDAGIALAQGSGLTPTQLLAEGIRSALASVFMAPQFLIKAELAPSEGFTGERDLNSYEIASRLSFFLTNSVPDDELWALAQNGTLTSPSVIEAQARRLYRSHPDEFVENFMGQWFGFRELANSTDPLEQAMFSETQLTMREIVTNDLPAATIVAPKFTYVNQLLADHYGIKGTFNKYFKRISLNDRGGILAQASVLRLTSSSLHETSPIRRGRWVQERLLCKTVPPPPAALADQIRAATLALPANATVKETLQFHRTAGAACNGCHQFMDPIGLGLEGFDPLGRKRTVYDDGRPVETDSTLFDVPFKNFEEMNDLLAANPDVQRCAGEKMAIHALGRVISTSGRDADLVTYLSSLEANAGRAMTFQDIMVKLVRSVAFRKVVHGAGANP